jgi:hypothetical protein
MGDNETIRNHAAFIWSVADLLRGDYKQSEYGKVILPMVVLRRLDCVLEPTKQAVLERHKAACAADREPGARPPPGRRAPAVLRHQSSTYLGVVKRTGGGSTYELPWTVSAPMQSRATLAS